MNLSSSFVFPLWSRGPHPYQVSILFLIPLISLFLFYQGFKLEIPFLKMTNFLQKWHNPFSLLGLSFFCSFDRSFSLTHQLSTFNLFNLINISSPWAQLISTTLYFICPSERYRWLLRWSKELGSWFNNLCTKNLL